MFCIIPWFIASYNRKYVEVRSESDKLNDITPREVTDSAI